MENLGLRCNTEHKGVRWSYRVEIKEKYQKGAGVHFCNTRSFVQRGRTEKGPGGRP